MKLDTRVNPKNRTKYNALQLMLFILKTIHTQKYQVDFSTDRKGMKVFFLSIKRYKIILGSPRKNRDCDWDYYV